MRFCWQRQNKCVNLQGDCFFATCLCKKKRKGKKYKLKAMKNSPYGIFFPKGDSILTFIYSNVSVFQKAGV